MADPSPAAVHSEGMVRTKRPIEKPFPSEHASRQNSPSKYKKFRRQNDKFGPGIHVIFGILPTGKTEVQSLRFDKNRFTPAEAKSWLKDHDYKTVLEPAVEKADHSDEYVRSFFHLAKRILPSWLFAQVHKLAWRKAGGHARWRGIKIPNYEPKSIEKADEPGSPDPKVMIAIGVPFDIGLKLTAYQRKGQPYVAPEQGCQAVDRLHVTLCYLGRFTAVGAELDRIREILSDMCEHQEPLLAHVHAVARFGATETSEGNDVITALIDCPGLSQLRARIVDALAFIGVPVAYDHDFTPHITLEFVTPLKQVEVPLPDLRFPVTRVELHVGLEAEHFEFAVVEETDDDTGIIEPRPMNVQMVEKSWRVPIAKLDKKKQIVYGVVLEPNTFDTQGDIITADEIEKTAHDFMERARRIGASHTKRVAAVPIESFLPDEDIHYGGELVKKGSWILGVHVNDPEVWKDCESGIYNAFSVGGFGERTGISEAA